MAYEVKPDGVYVDGTRVFVAFDRGCLACMVRAPSKAVFDAMALAVGLRFEDAEGNIRTPRTTTITELGPMVLAPGTYDAEGNELTPPVYDSRYHVNFWLGPDTVAAGAWQEWALQWTVNGTESVANNQEVAAVLNQIELIDPATVTSPSNRLA